MLFIGLLASILVKGKFCNVWLWNLISLFLIPHSVIKLMVCVPSASLFACAYSAFIESSRSLNIGSSRCLFGCTVRLPSPAATAASQKKWFLQRKDMIKQDAVLFIPKGGNKMGPVEE